MFGNDINNKLNRLNFEDILWILFALLAIYNIIGNKNEKNYLKSNNIIYEEKANKIFEFTLGVTLLIYIYFFIRNYNSFKQSSEKEKSLYTIKLLGSSLLIGGIVCLIYFQVNQENFIGSPGL